MEEEEERSMAMALWKVAFSELSELFSHLASLFFMWGTFKQFLPRTCIDSFWNKLIAYFKPETSITFYEKVSGRQGDYKRNEAYTAVENYLTTISTHQSKNLKAEFNKKKKSAKLSMDENEEAWDEFDGIKVKWFSGKYVSQSRTISYYPSDTEKRFYVLTFNTKYLKIVTENYLDYVVSEGRAIQFKRKQKRLYTNSPSNDGDDAWSYVAFEHPGTFQTLAMDPKKKEEIMNDLITFSKGKEYYAKIGKAWKRGYLLYGPPGTGKSTMIAAMANFLGYDVYDVELTSIKNNTVLRLMLGDISSKAIIVFEDIDCSLDLTGQRKNKKGKGGYKNPIAKKLEEDEEDNGGGESKVTLSGLLNFIDGLCAGCGGERIIVFTTNHVENLDPALIRRGRMDKHIELSYCKFEAFKVLAKNYLDIESHPLFEKISQLLEEVNMSPADVAENLMPKIEGGKAETCLESLIQALESLKEGEAQDKENRKEETEISLCESDAEETKSEVNSDSSKEDDNSSS